MEQPGYGYYDLDVMWLNLGILKTPPSGSQLNVKSISSLQ